MKPKRRKPISIDRSGNRFKMGEMARHSEAKADKDLGGLFIDRLNTRGADLVDEGAALLSQAGDDGGTDA